MMIGADAEGALKEQLLEALEDQTQQLYRRPYLRIGTAERTLILLNALFEVSPLYTLNWQHQTVTGFMCACSVTVKCWCHDQGCLCTGWRSFRGLAAGATGAPDRGGCRGAGRICCCIAAVLLDPCGEPQSSNPGAFILQHWSIMILILLPELLSEGRWKRYCM